MTLHERYKAIAKTGKGAFPVPKNTTAHNMVNDLNSRYLPERYKAITTEWDNTIFVVCSCCGD